MKCLIYVPVAFLLASGVLTSAQSTTVCPTSAVFLAVTDYNTGTSEVRGYPTRANGPTAPCQVLEGTATTLSTTNGMAISVHGDLHVVQFLTNGTVAVFPAAADGDEAPQRVESTYTNDLLAVATDARVDDFALSRREGPAAIAVILADKTTPSYSFNAPNFGQSDSLAVDTDDNLLVGGYDASGNALVETIGIASSLSSPATVRSLAGPDTGMLPGDSSNFSNNQISIAVDPVSDELYVYTYSDATGHAEVSVFPPRASGDVKPTRVIAGPLAQLESPGELNNKIAVASDGRLFVAEPNDRILVVAPGVTGNVAPAQTIQDSALGKTAVPQGGIGVRSCSCH